MTGEGAPGDRPEHDAVEQVQRAVLTAIGAVRVALDAVESLVADRQRLDHFAAGGREFVGSVWGTVFGRSAGTDEAGGAPGGSPGGSGGGAGDEADPPDSHPVD
jgi:hypothetical protein